MTGCAEHAAPGAPVETRAGIPPIVELQPMPDPVPVPPVPDALPPELFEGVTPMPAELLDFQDRLHELVGDSPDLGTGSVEDGYAHVVVRWYGDPPAEVLALVEEYDLADLGVTSRFPLFREAMEQPVPAGG
jgi:hypothetical protein